METKVGSKSFIHHYSIALKESPRRKAMNSGSEKYTAEAEEVDGAIR
jgi:hypothetical protein